MTSLSHRVVAQISMYPMDLPHVEQLLAHQIRVWAPMVDRIVVTVDVHRSQSGRYRGSDFEPQLAGLRLLLASFRNRYPDLLQVDEVDYSDRARKEVAQALFGLTDIPIKAWDGGPFYAYFYGVHRCDARYVVHFDGDMLFGGGSKTWVAESIDLMRSDTTVLMTAPFPGPPRKDGAISGHGSHVVRLPDVAGGPAYRFEHASTRIFMIDLQRLQQTMGVLPLPAPSLIQRFKAWLLGNPPHTLEAEVMLGIAMRHHGLSRIDLLGAAPGLWSLHPPYRSPEFYNRLSALISAVEGDKIPEQQRGLYDIDDCMVDWTQQRLAARRSKRWARLLKQRVKRL